MAREAKVTIKQEPTWFSSAVARSSFVGFHVTENLS